MGAVTNSRTDEIFSKLIAPENLANKDFEMSKVSVEIVSCFMGYEEFSKGSWENPLGTLRDYNFVLKRQKITGPF